MGELADELIEQQMFPDFHSLRDKHALEMPDDVFDGWMLRGIFPAWKALFVWTDAQGGKHPLASIGDTYLANIINHLRKRKDSLSLNGSADSRHKVGIVGDVIQLLKMEQAERYKNTSFVETPDMVENRQRDIFADEG